METLIPLAEADGLENPEPSEIGVLREEPHQSSVNMRQLLLWAHNYTNTYMIHKNTYSATSITIASSFFLVNT